MFRVTLGKKPKAMCVPDKYRCILQTLERTRKKINRKNKREGIIATIVVIPWTLAKLVLGDGSSNSTAN